MHDDQRPEDRPDEEAPRDWTEERYPLCDADFVDETLESVIRDRKAIEAEAQACDEEAFPPEQLDALQVPAASADFVDRCLDKVLAQQRADLRLRSQEDELLHELLHSNEAPEPSPRFVEDTLAAVLQDRARTAEPRAAGRGRLIRPFAGSFSRWASVAAILLCGILFFWPDPEDGSGQAPASFRSLEVGFTHSLPLAEPDQPRVRALERTPQLKRFINLWKAASTRPQEGR